MLRIGRLAVDRRRQGQGFGQDLLSFALHIALEFSEAVGLYAVVVDAKNETISGFYRQLGFVATLDNPLYLFLPIASLVKADVSPKGGLISGTPWRSFIHAGLQLSPLKTVLILLLG